MNRILVVDDEMDVLDTVATRLGAQDHEVIAARDGVEALQVLEREWEPVDLMILDLRMPGMDGPSLLGRLRGGRYPKPPILVLTAHGSPAVHERVLQFGADDYLEKPFEGLELVRRVNGLLNRPSSRQTPPPMVLALDDDADFQRMLDQRLTAAGYCVAHARSWAEAVRHVSIEKPDLVLMDLTMPGTDGHHACFQFKHDSRFADVPVIVVTARTDPVQHEKARFLGADAVVTKPLDGSDLERVMGRLLGKRGTVLPPDAAP